MTIKATKTASRERTSGPNGRPEHVPYVYRQQKRLNTYAAVIAQRNAGGLPQSAVVPAVTASPAEGLDDAGIADAGRVGPI